MRRLVALLALVVLTTGAAFGGIERGNRLYRAGQYAEAVEAYRSAIGTRDDSPVLRYNLGTALLRLGRYEEAEEQLRVALDGGGPDLRSAVEYNLGQRFLEDARSSRDAAAADALYEAALEAYRNALRLDPADADAKWNYELALRERESMPPQASGEGEAEGQDGDPRGDPEGDGLGGAAGTPGAGDRAASGAGEHAPMTPEEAERILNAIEQGERDLVRSRLQQNRQGSRVERDW